MTHSPSARAEVITRRTYSRPKDDGSFESWGDIVDRVIRHQKWLWERARGEIPLAFHELEELGHLRDILLDRRASVSGRTLWLGGTEIARRREASMFNCAFTKIETVHDVVDAFWLLLQGCGVGFAPEVGSLNGFTKPLEVRTIRSQRHLLEQKRGRETNHEEWIHEGAEGLTWRLSIGDSAEAWAKAVGKLLAGKRPADRLVLDFSQVRPAGERLKGYGWISSGDETFAPALERIAKVMNNRAGQLLRKMDILDIINLLGTTLSSRRSAEIALVEYGDAEWIDFAEAKEKFWERDNNHRQQSNNSLLFNAKPLKEDLKTVFQMMEKAGGSEPGFINGEEALRRGAWFKGVNPCGEILLPNKGFCNLVDHNLSRYNGNRLGDLMHSHYVLARANYRQTCVNLQDGILQRAWHENNEFLRLCGVGVTGVAQWEHRHNPDMWDSLRAAAQEGARDMAYDLGTPCPKAVTTVKPSGTLSKIMDTTEGVHTPLGRFIFNNVRFSRHDPYCGVLRAAGYRVFDDPTSPDAVLVTFPVEYNGCVFTEELRGDGSVIHVNRESAIKQLDRYKLLMEHYVDHNCSVTISYDSTEVPAIIDWLHREWDNYVGVSFIYRNDPSKTAADLGYLYLPQEVVTQEVFLAYANTLKPLKVALKGPEEMTPAVDDYELDTGECAGGACPIR